MIFEEERISKLIINVRVKCVYIFICADIGGEPEILKFKSIIKNTDVVEYLINSSKI